MLTALAVGMLAQAFPTGLVSLAVLFFVIALLSYALGATGFAGMSAAIGRMLLVVFLVLAVLSVIVALVHHA